MRLIAAVSRQMMSKLPVHGGGSLATLAASLTIASMFNAFLRVSSRIASSSPSSVSGYIDVVAAARAPSGSEVEYSHCLCGVGLSQTVAG